MKSPPQPARLPTIRTISPLPNGDWRLPAGDSREHALQPARADHRRERREPRRSATTLSTGIPHGHEGRAARRRTTRCIVVTPFPNNLIARRSHQARRRVEVDLPAASRSARRRHRVLRRRQSRRELRATARSSTTCSTRTPSRSTPRPARRCGARASATSTSARRSPWRRWSSKDKVIVGNSGGELGVRG